GPPVHPQPPGTRRRIRPHATLRRAGAGRGGRPRGQLPGRRQCDPLLPLAADRAADCRTALRQGDRHGPL
ncbi:MAG: hypothetical protein AVDCRST_MAG44-1202, partial [uncultured Sphingomonas sp.]